MLPRFAEPITAMIEENPSFGYRTVAHLLNFNKNTVQRIFQLKGWQVKKDRLDSGLGSKHCPPWPDSPMNVGRLIYVGSGLVAMAGRYWRWSSTAIRGNCRAGTCRALVKPGPPRWRCNGH